MKEIDEIRELLREVAISQKETDRQFKETDRQFKETALQFKETDKRIRELSGLFTTQWGKLVEALVRPGTLKLFQERGISIVQHHRENLSTRGGNHMELDVILVNGEEAVVVEVKTTMKVDFVREFLEDLEEVKAYFSVLENKKVYGAVAALKYDEESDRYAQRKGLFTIKVTGEDTLNIDNPVTFQPQSW